MTWKLIGFMGFMKNFSLSYLEGYVVTCTGITIMIQFLCSKKTLEFGRAGQYKYTPDSIAKTSSDLVRRRDRRSGNSEVIQIGRAVNINSAKASGSHQPE